MGLVNALLGLLLSLGVHLRPDQEAAIGGFVNASLVLLVHVSHAQAKRATAPAVNASGVQSDTGTA